MHIFCVKSPIFVQILCRMHAYTHFPAFLRSSVVLSVMAASIIVSSCSRQDKYVAVTGFAQGGTYSVKLNLNGADGRVPISPKEIKDDIDSILLDIDNSLSGYNKGSLLSRFNAGETIVLNDMFVEIYRMARRFYDETGKAVDVASAPLFDIWGFGFTSDSLPSAARIGECLEACGLDRMKQEIPDTGILSSSDMLLSDAGGALPKLNYNAIAQGYSCDVIARYLYSIGVKDMLVDIGGEIYCDGCNPSGKPWAIGIDRPVDGSQVSGADIQAVLEVPRGARGIVTSGNYRKFYIKDGRKYAHTVDPRSGYPVGHSLLSATIMTQGDVTAADAYATYCMVIGVDEAIRFIESRTDIEGYLVYADGDSMRTWTSEGFVVR